MKHTMKTIDLISAIQDRAEDLRSVETLLDVLMEHLLSAGGPSPFVFDDDDTSRWVNLVSVQRYITSTEVARERMLDIARSLEDIAKLLSDGQKREAGEHR